jgi:hypothetical protein
MVAIFGSASAATAQDALRGKRLYLDAAGAVGTTVSCVDCHGGLPGGAFGIGAAADDPAAVEMAIQTIPQMTPFRGRLGAIDFADLAAYIGNPSVPSPDARVATYAPSGEQGPPERIELGELEAGTASEPAIVELRNAGAIPFDVTAAPLLSGTHDSELSIEANDCVAGLVLASEQSCHVSIIFAPTGEPGPRSARIASSHDWVRGAVAVALFGSAREPRRPPRPPEMPSSGCSINETGGVLLIALLLVPFARASRATRARARRRGPCPVPSR